MAGSVPPMSFAERGGWWVLAQAALLVLYAVAALFTEGVEEGFGLGYARVVGVLLIAGAAVMAAWAAALMGTRITPYPAPHAQSVLIERGPYLLVRHPMYGALIIAATGLGLVLVNPWVLAVALLFPVFFTAKAGHEETLCMAALPGYREYRSRVPHRLIPWVL